MEWTKRGGSTAFERFIERPAYGQVPSRELTRVPRPSTVSSQPFLAMPAERAYVAKMSPTLMTAEEIAPRDHSGQAI